MSDGEQAQDEIDVDPERVASWLAQDPSLQVIDVREPYEREAGHIAGTRHIQLVNLTGEASTVDARPSRRFLLPRRRALADGRAGVSRGRLRRLHDGRRPQALGRAGTAAGA